jgi:hypothetical protein
MAAELFRPVWTRIVFGTPRVTALEPAGREQVLAEFDKTLTTPEIRKAVEAGKGRLRVMREQDYQASKAAR